MRNDVEFYCALMVVAAWIITLAGLIYFAL